MHRLAEGYAARDTAAEAAMARIDTDLKRAEPAVQPALLHLGANLFEPSLNVKTLRRATGNTSSEFFHVFRAAVGTSPEDYIRSLRLTTAAALLRDTDLPVYEIARLAGYGALKTFRTRFRRHHGTTPGRYRCERALDMRSAGPQGEDHDALDLEAPAWRRLFGQWPEAADRAPAAWTADERHASARRRAEEAWAVARALSEVARRKLVAFAGRTTPALAELLFVRSRIEGRGNRAWGIAVAELALVAIPEHANAWWKVDDLHQARIRGHAWLGNAYRLSLDFPNAEAAFERARQALEADALQCSVRGRAELSWLEAGLYWTRSNYERARELADEAVDLAEIEGMTDLIVPLLRRRAAIAADAGHVGESVLDLRKCLDLLPPCEPGEDRLAVHLALAQDHLVLEQADLAASQLAQAEQWSAHSPDPRIEAAICLARGRLDWQRGDLERAAKSLEGTLRRFEALDARFDIIVTMIDLCAVRLEAEDHEAAFDIARQLLPALRFLDADAEWNRLVQELQASVTKRILKLALLRQLRAIMPRWARRAALQGVLPHA